ncbi:MAG TPA: methyltransferase domain-containing protein [Kofleriaceae bacterium]
MKDDLVKRAQLAREQLRRGELRGDELRALIESVPFVDRDPFVDELLELPPMPEDVELPRGAVPYLPCPVGDILTVIREAPIGQGDTFIDLGSGIGRVAILVNLLVGVRAHGMEIQPHLVELARGYAADLGLDRVSFECRDVREMPADRLHAEREAGLSDDQKMRFVLFLFAPFNGEMLASALEAIGEFARDRKVTVCAVSMELPDLPWLVRGPSASKTVSIFHSR